MVEQCGVLVRCRQGGEEAYLFHGRSFVMKRLGEQ